MNYDFDAIAIRVLGCLMEKELATPEYYPLSLNALVNACNQKTNRSPVMQLDETVVSAAVRTLQEQRFVYRSDASRVPKYWQAFAKDHDLGNGEAALLAVLLLRGPQTVGELRGRTDSMCPFASLDQVASALEHLATAGLVAQLPRQPGQKEQRYVHLLAADSGSVDQATVVPADGNTSPAPVDRLAQLEEAVATLREELAQVRQELRDFKQSLE